MIPASVTRNFYDPKLADILCQASADAYRSRCWIGSIQKRWKASACELAEIDGNEVLFLADERHVIISFRGTSSVGDAQRDTTAKRHEWQRLSVHQGFFLGWLQLKPLVEQWLKQHVHGDVKLFVCGHSLGGALATLCATELSEQGYQPILYTFGSPRVGGRAFAWYVNRMLQGRHFRVTHHRDIVPYIPLVFRANLLLPDWLPLLPTPRRLVHCGQRIHLRRRIGLLKLLLSNPLLDHSLARYRQAISDNA